MTDQAISADFPFESKFVDVHGSNMHYIDEGEGDPVLFLHGNPTSCYLWRNIVPYVTPFARCIAPDLIGMGKSDEPELEYSFLDHVEYLEGFIDKLGLKNVTLVVHDWGSALGFHYAMRNESNVIGIAFMEGIVRPMAWDGKPLDLRIGFTLFRTPVIGWFMISVMNLFLSRILPQLIVRKLTPHEHGYYGAPYQSIGDRKPVRRWPCELPIEGKPKEIVSLVENYCEKLQASTIPKLLCYANPGLAIDAKEVDWCKQNLKNLTTVDVGEGLHFIQEDRPHQIGEALAQWRREI